jgi:hypothetical protein
MKARAFTINDLNEIKELHEKYYKEFDFPDFMHLLNAFVIEDDKGIIMAGGIEQVAEAVLVTNRDRSNIAIGKALVEAQLVSLYTCKKFGIRELYAFVSNESYAKHLIQHGFAKHGLEALSMRVP